ncbi:hypothetical protein Nmel_003792 [Mimus melanotis]
MLHTELSYIENFSEPLRAAYPSMAIWALPRSVQSFPQEIPHR